MKGSVWLKIGITSALILGAVGIIVYTASQSSGIFRFVNEVRAESRDLQGRELWMAGDLEPNSHKSRTTADKREEHQFVLTHKGARIPVSYVGSLPANVQPGRQLVVRGKLAAGGQRFEAAEVRTKCPSKYKAQYEARK